MGIVTSITSTCAGCLAGVITDEDSEAKLERQGELKKGYKFMRSTMLGLSSQTIFVELSDNLSLLKWKTISTGILSKQEHGEIDLTNDVKGFKMLGLMGLSIIGKESDKSIFDIQADDQKVRDRWVLSLNELLTNWAVHPESKPKSVLTASGTSNKDEYFAKREKEIKEREKDAEEKKKKYANVGMKNTAMAMANRA